MRAVKIPRLEGGSLGHSTESSINCDGPISMVPGLNEGNIYIKRKLWVWREQKCILLVGSITPLNCEGRQNTPSRGRQYSAKNAKFGKLGRTYGYGTVFAPRKYLHKRKLRVWRDQKCIPLVGAITTLSCEGRHNTPS